MTVHMNRNTYSQLTGYIFILIAILHLARIVWSWDAVIGGWTVPLWLSWIALIVGAYLGYQGLRMKR